MTFGNRLKLILEFKRISQRTFAKEVHMSESQLSKLLNDKKKPTTRELESIIDVLQIPYACMIGKVDLFDELLSGRGLWLYDDIKRVRN